MNNEELAASLRRAAALAVTALGEHWEQEPDEEPDEQHNHKNERPTLDMPVDEQVGEAAPNVYRFKLLFSTDALFADGYYTKQTTEEVQAFLESALSQTMEDVAAFRVEFISVDQGQRRHQDPEQPGMIDNGPQKFEAVIQATTFMEKDEFRNAVKSVLPGFKFEDAYYTQQKRKVNDDLPENIVSPNGRDVKKEDWPRSPGPDVSRFNSLDTQAAPSAKEIALGLGLALAPSPAAPAKHEAPKKQYVCPDKGQTWTCEEPRIKPKAGSDDPAAAAAQFLHAPESSVSSGWLTASAPKKHDDGEKPPVDDSCEDCGADIKHCTCKNFAHAADEMMSGLGDSLRRIVAGTAYEQPTAEAISQYGEDNALIGLYWYCVNYHGGQDSTEYSILSQLGDSYQPAGHANGPEPDSAEELAYEHFGGTVDDGSGGGDEPINDQRNGPSDDPHEASADDSAGPGGGAGSNTRAPNGDPTRAW